MAKINLHKRNEQELVHACVQGDRGAQKELYNLYVEQMMVMCMRYITNKEDAKETMLDGFYNIFKNLKAFEYRGAGSLTAWVSKLMVNQCLMFIRKRDNILKDADDIDGVNEVAFNNDTLSKLNAKEILQIIHQLPSGYRAVFNLYSFEGYKHREIASMLNISENTSKSQLRKAKMMLQKSLLNQTKV